MSRPFWIASGCTKSCIRWRRRRQIRRLVNRILCYNNIILCNDVILWKTRTIYDLSKKYKLKKTNILFGTFYSMHYNTSSCEQSSHIHYLHDIYIGTRFQYGCFPVNNRLFTETFFSNIQHVISLNLFLLTPHIFVIEVRLGNYDSKNFIHHVSASKIFQHMWGGLDR